MEENREQGTGNRGQRQVAVGSLSAPSHLFLSTVPCLLSPVSCLLSPARRGISLLEVLISIFILAVGLLSIASLLPVGGYQAQKATIEDRKSTIGQNAFHEFRTRGMANAENWMGFPMQPGQTFPRPVSVAIDPLGFTAPVTAGTNISKVFPRATPSAASAPSMLRVGLKFATGPTAAAAHQVAQQIFMSHDDTVFEENPNDPDAPALSKWEVDNNNQPIRRQFMGDFSWMATLAPVYFDLSPPGPWVWPAEYHLSLVIFHKRNLTLLANEQGVAYERQVAVSPRAQDLAGFGLGGGELLLLGNEAETAVKSGNWVMVCGRYGDPSQGQPVFRWYRVATVGAYENDLGVRPVTLAGPDWIGVTNQTDPTQWLCKPSHVAVFEGCVGVFEKTVHLEGPSVWSY